MKKAQDTLFMHASKHKTLVRLIQILHFKISIYKYFIINMLHSSGQYKILTLQNSVNILKVNFDSESNIVSELNIL